jgi:hypothetical protein
MDLWADLKNAVTGRTDGPAPVREEVPPHRGVVPITEPDGKGPPPPADTKPWYAFLLPHKEKPELIGFADDKSGNTLAVFKDKNGDRQWCMDQKQIDREIRKAKDNGDDERLKMYTKAKDGLDSIRQNQTYLGPPIGSPYDFRKNGSNGPDQPKGVNPNPQLNTAPDDGMYHILSLNSPGNGNLDLSQGAIRGPLDLTSTFTGAVLAVLPQPVANAALNAGNRIPGPPANTASINDVKPG